MITIQTTIWGHAQSSHRKYGQAIGKIAIRVVLCTIYNSVEEYTLVHYGENFASKLYYIIEAKFYPTNLSGIVFKK